jgi:hypothetical protein
MATAEYTIKSHRLRPLPQLRATISSVHSNISLNGIVFLQQQYSPMVMRKFRKSIDNGTSPAAAAAANGDDDHVGLNSPRLPRKSKGPSLPDGLNDSIESPATARRRRSRIPSEEDDKLMNFLVSGSNVNDRNRERLSVGGLGKCSQRNALS